MLTMAVGQSDDVDPVRAIAEAIAQCRDGLGGRVPQAGLLFASFDAFEPSMLHAIQEAFPDLRLVGGSSAAEVSSAGGYLEDSITLAVFASDRVDFTTGLGTGLQEDADRACQAAVQQAMAGTDQEPRLCIMFTMAVPAGIQSAVEAMTRALPEGVLLVGGGAAKNDLRFPLPTYQFQGETVAEDGVAILLLSGPLRVSLASGTGWQTIGPRGTVTRSEAGAILEVDGQPAREFIAGYLDHAGPTTYGNPLAVREVGDSEPYLRVILGIDESTGALRVPGRVPAGSVVQLTTAGTNEIVAAVSEVVRRASSDFPDDASPAAALIFSCAVRKFLLGSRTRDEIAGVRTILPASIPLAGMYCSGEIAPTAAGSDSRLLNETFVTVLLGA